MAELIENLTQRMRAGDTGGVVPSVLEFYRQFDRNSEDYLLLDEGNIAIEDVCCEVQNLLKEWVQHPGVSAEAKSKLLLDIEAIADLDFFEEYGVTDIKKLSMELMALVYSPDDELKRLNHILDNGVSQIDAAEYLVRKVELLRLLGRDEEAELVVKENVSCHSVLEPEIVRLLDAGFASKALELIELAESTTEYRQNIWLKKKKLLAYELLALREEGIRLARELFLTFSYNLSYYEKLKRWVAKDEWPAFWDSLLKAAHRKSDFCVNENLMDIYVLEQSYDKVFEAIKKAQYRVLPYVLKYTPKLPSVFLDDMLQIGQACLQKLAARASNRGDYVSLVNDMRKFAALPQSAPIIERLLNSFRTLYRRRRAMMEELGKM